MLELEVDAPRPARRMQDQSHSLNPGDASCSRRPARERRKRAKPSAKAQAPASMTQALQAIPASRDGVVPRARKLVRDTGYPSEATLNMIAQLFLSHLELDEQSY